MSLAKGDLLKPKPFRVIGDNLILDFDWSNKLLQSEKVGELPIIGARLLADTNGQEVGENNVLSRPYLWGKAGTLLRRLPKLVIICDSGNIGSGYIQAIGEIRTELEAAGICVLVVGSILDQGTVIPSDSLTEIGGETHFSFPAQETDHIDPDDHYKDYRLNVTAEPQVYPTYNLSKWEGNEVLYIFTQSAEGQVPVFNTYYYNDSGSFRFGIPNDGRDATEFDVFGLLFNRWLFGARSTVTDFVPGTGFVVTEYHYQSQINEALVEQDAAALGQITNPIYYTKVGARCLLRKILLLPTAADPIEAAELVRARDEIFRQYSDCFGTVFSGVSVEEFETDTFDLPEDTEQEAANKIVEWIREFYEL